MTKNTIKARDVYSLLTCVYRTSRHLFLFSLIELLILVTMQLVHVKFLQITKDSVAQHNCCFKAG